MRKEFLNDELILFQVAFREFLKTEVTPFHKEWEKDGVVPREIWEKAGASNFLGIDVPTQYGGSSIKDFRFNCIVIEEIFNSASSGLGFTIQNDLVIPYLLKYCNDKQKERWLPKLCTGEYISSLAMTEPGAGSDLSSIKTTAILKGDYYIVNGQKTFITNGLLSDIAIVAVKTDPNLGFKGISLLVIERGMNGFERGNNLDKIGLKAQDTSEFFFNNVKVPVDNLLGEEGKGFYYLTDNLPRERLSIAVGAIACIETVLDYTIQYCKDRIAFGQPIGNFQYNKFTLAELKTKVEIGRIFIDHCIDQLNNKKLTPEVAAMAKWWSTDLQTKLVDKCLQLHGGYGYMLEYPIAKAYIDSRVQPLYGGTNEIMKEIIGRSLGFK